MSNEEILVAALQECYDEAYHTHGTEAEFPLEIARENAKHIQKVVKEALKKTGFSA